MFDSLVHIESNQFTRYELTENGALLSYSRVLDLLAHSEQFRSYFTQLIAACPSGGFRWETPPVTTSTIARQFQFVIVDTPEFITRRVDEYAFQEHFVDDGVNQGVVTFKNIGGDASLIVPSPHAETKVDTEVYGHLGAFIRGAPEKQIDAFWRVVGIAVTKSLGNSPIWLSSAGGGVAWLHMRLDSAPKYYSYLPFKANPGFNS